MMRYQAYTYGLLLAARNSTDSNNWNWLDRELMQVGARCIQGFNDYNLWNARRNVR